MTTILADARLGVMVSDSRVSDDSRAWTERKVFRVRGALVGIAGPSIKTNYFLDWFRDPSDAPPDFEFEDAEALVLDHTGLRYFSENETGLRKWEKPYNAIGSGGVAALAAHEALKFKSPRRAVAIACNHDSNSGRPVRTYRL